MLGANVAQRWKCYKAILAMYAQSSDQMVSILSQSRMYTMTAVQQDGTCLLERWFIAVAPVTRLWAPYFSAMAICSLLRTCRQ